MVIVKACREPGGADWSRSQCVAELFADAAGGGGCCEMLGLLPGRVLVTQGRLAETRLTLGLIPQLRWS